MLRGGVSKRGADDGEVPRVLILEDEWLIALDLQMVLEDAGYAIAGPASSVSGALELIRREEIAAGLLDLHVGEQTSYPIAVALRELGIPFLFLTGHTRANLEPEFRNESVVSKPIERRDLVRRLEAIVGTGAR
jgi:DNA-binding response OmpR family regulator